MTTVESMSWGGTCVDPGAREIASLQFEQEEAASGSRKELRERTQVLGVDDGDSTLLNLEQPPNTPDNGVLVELELPLPEYDHMQYHAWSVH